MRLHINEISTIVESLEKTNTINHNSDNFNRYLDSYKGEVQNKRSEGYYHVDVVAEAYKQGFSDGKLSGKKDFLDDIISDEIELFTQKANQIYILSKNIVSILQKNNFNANSLHINLSFNRPRVIISLPNKFLNDDNCVDLAYLQINENRKIFYKLFKENLDIGLVASDHLDENILQEDGFGYQENYT
ncbi:hypothetical protein [Ascidiimonas aurantiaca]|uniref:hypothetical protein n=1 Tax=Ascidiimonas aurantiaca TaxID=1685432 RepID=UPI0030EE77BA